MSKLTLSLQPRTVSGRAVKRLRRDGLVPGNIFGKNLKSISIQVKSTDLRKAYDQAGETTIIYTTVEGEKEERPLLISALQIHPVTSAPIHVDFHQVDLKQKVTATVPITLIGESPAVTDEGAVLVQSMNEIDVEALPSDLPHEIQLDITSLLKFGDTLTVKDLKVDTSKIELQAEAEELVVQVQEPKAEEEEPAPAEAEGEAAPAEAEAAPQAPAETPAKEE